MTEKPKGPSLEDILGVDPKSFAAKAAYKAAVYHMIDEERPIILALLFQYAFSEANTQGINIPALLLAHMIKVELITSYINELVLQQGGETFSLKLTSLQEQVREYVDTFDISSMVKKILEIEKKKKESK